MHSPAQTKRSIDPAASRDVASQGAQRLAPGELAARDAIFATLHSQARAMAHALGNPLTGLGLTLELLASTQLTDLQQRYVDRCSRVIERLNGYKDNLSRLGSPNTLTLVPVSVQACIDAAMTHLRPGPSFPIEVLVDSQASTVMAHEGLLGSALIELLRNAIEALGQGGKLGIHSTREGGQVTLTVWDDGPGLSQAVQRQLWVSPIGGKAHSSGLGLFWAAAIVDHVHGGRLSQSTRPGGGTAFHIALAACPEPS